MGDRMLSLSRPVAQVLGPILLRQAARVRQRTVLLPEAAGDRFGSIAGAGPGAPLRLAVVGESTAAGVGVADQHAGLPHRLATELAERRNRSVAWTVSARTGATVGSTTRELVAALPPDADLVVVVLGVNDSLKLRPRKVWHSRIEALVDLTAARHLRPGGVTLLCGVPDLGRFGTFPQSLRAVLGWHAHALDQVLRRVAELSPAAHYVAMPPLSWPSMFATDGFHPNAAAYRAWAAHLAAELAPLHP